MNPYAMQSQLVAAIRTAAQLDHELQTYPGWSLGKLFRLTRRALLRAQVGTLSRRLHASS